MKKGILAPYIIGSAIIWGVTILGASLTMEGVQDTSKVLSLLGTGAGVHLILIWGPLAAALGKAVKQQEDGRGE